LFEQIIVTSTCIREPYPKFDFRFWEIFGDRKVCHKSLLEWVNEAFITLGRDRYGHT